MHKVKKHIISLISLILISACLYFTLNWLLSEQILTIVKAKMININNNIVDYLIAMLGVYIAILVLFATSRTPVSSIIVDKHLSDNLVQTVIFAGSYAIADIIINSLEISMFYFVVLQTLLSIIATIYSIIFLIIVVLIFKYNITSLEKQGRYDDQIKENTYTILLEINENIKDEQRKSNR